jgi:hypothetical protein
MIRDRSKRLLQLEKNINELRDIGRHNEEYLQWLEENPMGNEPPFDFYNWMDSMPKHLIPCFQYHVKLTFPHLFTR